MLFPLKDDGDPLSTKNPGTISQGDPADTTAG
jgi:hypothetical protein